MGGLIQDIDYAAISPALIVAVAAIGLLLADAFDVPRRVLGLAGGGALAAALVAVVALAFGDRRATFCLPGELRGAGPPSCSYVTDDFTLIFQGVVLAAALVVLLLSVDEITVSRLPAGEYYFLLLAAITGALTLVAARDLVLLVVALETLSLPVFALVALRRYDGVATEAALKLFLVSVISAAVMLFGISLVYGVTGSMHLDRIAPALGRISGDLEPVAAMGVVLVLAGFAFKVAAVPFHFWAPDVYQGAPLPVTVFLSVVSKAAGFAGLAIVVALGFPAYGHVWGPLLAVLAAVTMTLGNLVALRQRSAVRLLAWSSIAQSGYMLAPLAVGASKELPAAVAATVAYVAMYAVMNLGAFAVVTGFERRIALPPGDRASGAPPSEAVSSGALPSGERASGALSSGDLPSGALSSGERASGALPSGAMPSGAVRSGDLPSLERASNELEDYRGLARWSPATAAALAFFLICLAGLPPGVMGLFAKIVVFRATVAGGVTWLAVIMAINTVIGLYYYLSWAARLFARPAAQTEPYTLPSGGVLRAAVGAAAAGAVVLSVAPQLVLQAASAIG